MAEDCWLQARLYLGLEHSPEQQDVDSLSFSILVGHGQSHTFRVELASELHTWEKSFQRAVFLEVQRIQVSPPLLRRGAPPLLLRSSSTFLTSRPLLFVVGGKKGRHFSPQTIKRVKG